MKTRQLFQSMQGRRRSSSSPLSAIFSAEAPQSTYYNGCTKNNYLHTTLPKSQTNNRAAVTIANTTSTHPSSPHSGYSRSQKNYTRLLSSFKHSESSPSPSSSIIIIWTGTEKVKISHRDHHHREQRIFTELGRLQSPRNLHQRMIYDFLQEKNNWMQMRIYYYMLKRRNDVLLFFFFLQIGATFH